MLKDKVLNISSKVAYRLKDKSPKLFLIGGIGGIAVATVLACKATLKAEPVVEAHISKIEKVKNETPEDRKQITREYVTLFLDAVKLYSVPIGLGVGSIYCITKGYRILEDKNIKLVGTVKLIESAFNKYRQRVVDEYGEDTDRMFYHNLKKKDILIEENGKTKTVKDAEVLDDINPLDVSYDRVFDESNSEWTGHPDEDIWFLKRQENYANDILKSRGYIFLNEVYDLLGFGPTEAGQFVGWAKGRGEGFVDFGLSDISQECNRKFINGESKYVLLTFNTDGYIADKI